MDIASPLAKTGKIGAVYAPLAKLFEIIDDARRQRRVSGASLARAAGMHPASYSRLRTDADSVTTETLQNLLTALAEAGADG